MVSRRPLTDEHFAGVWPSCATRPTPPSGRPFRVAPRYDVADGGISGLSNCGYRDDDEALVPRAVWAPRLNEHGLFDDVEHAVAFRGLTDRRAPEHAPFAVYGLWRV